MWTEREEKELEKNGEREREIGRESTVKRRDKTKFMRGEQERKMKKT